MPHLKGPVPQVQAKEGPMPQLVKKRRSGWAVLAAGALVASLFAVGASPAAAIDEDSKPDHPAEGTACLGAALGDAGFMDTAGLNAEADINCLAHYGIAAGKTADMFDPNSNVTRSQMALFLSRAAGVMGVDLMGGDMMVDFGDIDELGEDRQAAIESLASNGIMAGRSDMAFAPHADITRAEMAVALVNLVDMSSDAVSKDAMTGLFVLGASNAQPNDTFTDAYTMTSQPVNNAISVAYELEIATGYDDGTFRPNDSVARKNMASFIARTLAHSNARPVGLSAQVSNGSITVSVRGADFAPEVNQAIDAFKIPAVQEAKAFKDDGTCSSRTSMIMGEGATKCEIDGADPVTQSDGNVTLAALGADEIGEGLTVWVWAGEIGDKFGSTTDASEVSVMPSAAAAVTAASATVTNDLAKGATKVHYGSAITVTIQLMGVDANAKDAKAMASDPAEKFDVVTKVHAGGTTAADVYTQNTQTLTVGSDGSATFTLQISDPDPRSGMSNMNAVSYTVTHNSDSPYTVTGGTGNVVFSDEAPMASALSVKVAAYQDVPATGASTGAAATVTVVDQYAMPFKGAGVVLTSSEPTSVLPTSARVTGSNGQVRIGYTYMGAAGAQVETLTARHTRADGTDIQGTASAYWVVAAGAGDGTRKTIGVLNADLDANMVIVDMSMPMSVTYDSNDYFHLSGTPASMEDFEEALGKALQDVADGMKPDTFTLEWEHYVFDDASSITMFDLVIK